MCCMREIDIGVEWILCKSSKNQGDFRHMVRVKNTHIIGNKYIIIIQIHLNNSSVVLILIITYATKKLVNEVYLGWMVKNAIQYR